MYEDVIFLNISIIGGDLRIVRLAEMYADEGNIIYVYGLEKYFIKETNPNIIVCNTISEATSKSNIIISSMPFSRDNITVNAPYAIETIKIEDLEKEIENKTFIAGGIPNEFYKKEIHNIDLLQNEELTILNAIPTVEGTIKIAIEEREETIYESNILICGFGRIGKILCNRFKALGANVYCVARKEADLTWIRENRYIPLTYQKVSEIGEKFDIVINTVPTLVLKEKELNSFKQDVLIIELASIPGGIDKEYAEKKKLKIITAMRNTRKTNA